MSKILNSHMEGGNLKYGKFQNEEILLDILFKQLAEIEYSKYLQMKLDVENQEKLKVIKSECRIILFSPLNWKPFKKVV